MIALLPNGDTEFRLEFAPTDEPKIRLNQIHLHLTSTSLEDQEATVARALELASAEDVVLLANDDIRGACDVLRGVFSLASGAQLAGKPTGSGYGVA